MYNHALVTGGAGFVGSSLALALKKSQPEMRVNAFDNLRRRGSELNLDRLARGGVAFGHGDVRSAGDLASVTPPPDLILECSAEPSALAGYGGSPEYLVQTNLVGCFNCLELARREKADFIFLSTSRVYPYGLLNGLTFTETHMRFSLTAGQTIAGASECGISEAFPLDGARSLYGMTKLAAELMVAEYADAYGFGFIINRCGLIAGPHQMGKTDQGVMALWMAAHYFGKPLTYTGFGGTGKQVRDILHIDDVCDLVADQTQNFSSYRGEIFNAGGGLTHSLSLVEATQLCRELTGNGVEISSQQQDRPADVRIYLSDCRKVSRVRGWQPKRDARRTLHDIHEWIHAEEGRVKDVLLAGL
jgi:CDP-paratose 2-epimerase